ncbi:MAG: RpiR family transcriptional regulator, partial [Acidobacteriota bacterium]|nr:RpiR family transcriptional regulator [Acidobacteriota bacterium]
KLSDLELRSWIGLVAVAPGERPDVIVRKASAPKSVFRGMVDGRDVACCDVLQVWLDVAAHPSRGEEQAELIYRKVLRPVVEGAGK